MHRRSHGVIALLLASIVGPLAAAGSDAPALLGTVSAQHWTAPGGARHAVPSPDHALTVLVFLAPDCPVANRYAPTLNALHQTFARKNVQLFRVYSGPDIAPQDVERHSHDFALAPVALLDPASACARGAGARRTPQAVVLDREGRIFYRGRIDDRYIDFGKYRHAPTRNDLEEAVDAALKNQTLPENDTDAVGCFIPMPAAEAPCEETETP